MIFYKNKGFTILEMLMAIAIGAIVVTIITLSFGKLNSEQALDKSAMTVVSVLDEARSLTLASLNATRYGVRLEDSQVIILPTYATTTINALVGIRNINLNGGGDTVYFERLSGATLQSGTFEVYLKNSSTTFRTISINTNGLAE